MELIRGLRRGALLAALAGLAAAQAAPAAPPTLTVHDCSEQNLLLIYPAALYKHLLPAGFKFPGLGLSAQILVSGATCSGADGQLESELLSFMEVVPTATYTDPAIPLYAIALDSYATRPETVAAFAAAGFGDTVHPGTVAVASVDHPLLHERSGHVVAGTGAGQVITSSTVFGPVETVPASRTRLFAVRDGQVVGIIDGDYTAHPGYAGVGTLLKAGSGPMVAPFAASVATHETGFALSLIPQPLP